MLKSQKTSFDVTFDMRPSPISSTSSLHSGGSDVAMCPPAAGLAGSGDGFTGASAPAGPSAPLEHVVRELAAWFAHQNEQFSVLARNMADMQKQLCELSSAAALTAEWMPTHEARASDVDKFLDSLREYLDALRSASVSVETTSVVSDWPLLKVTASVGTGSHRRPSQSHTPGESVGSSQPPGTRQKPRSLGLKRHLRNGISRMTNFRGVLFGSIFHWVTAKILSRNFVVKPSPVQNLTGMRSNAKKSPTLPASCFTPELLVSNSLRPIQVSGCDFLPIIPWLSANQPKLLFTKPELSRSARW